MKTSSYVSLLLGVLLFGLTVSAVFVDVSPNRAQFLQGESVSLRCARGHPGHPSSISAGWRLKRADAYGGQTQSCDEDQQDFGMFAGSSCIVSNLSPAADNSIYWCEDKAGTKSGNLRIHVSDQVILQIPALPVMTGDKVTLRCRSSYKGWSFKIERVIGEEKKVDYLPPEFTISSVQWSDEGDYSCSALVSDMMMLSGESRLTVRDPPATTSLPPSSLPPTSLLPSSPPPSSPPPSSHSLPPPLSVFRVLLPLLAFCLYCISAGVMVFICCSRKKTGSQPAVSMEMTEREEGVEYDDVTTEHAQ